MRINHIIVEDQVVHIGATNEQRWQWELEDGYNGSEAKTLVTFTLDFSGGHKNVAPNETVQFFTFPSDHLRKSCYGVVGALAEVVWAIYDAKMDEKEAKFNFFGKHLRGK